MGKLSSKERKSIKLTPGKQQQFAAALVEYQLHYGPVLVEYQLHYGPVLASWPQLSERQRRELLASSPILSGLKNLLEPLFRS